MKEISLKPFFLIVVLAGITFVCRASSDEDLKATFDAGYVEKQVTLDNGVLINYSEGPANGKRALLLVHGQTGAWQDYKKVLPALSKNWHVFAVDCHGHGKSQHDSARYYVDSIGNDLIRFVHQVIRFETMVSGHSSGALIAAYVAGRGDDRIVGSLLEDPPVFSTEKEEFPNTFVYHDMFKNVHGYLTSDRKEPYEIYYLRNCYWGKLYLPGKMDQLADAAMESLLKHPDEPIQIAFVPPNVNDMISSMLLYFKYYDVIFGEHYYNSSWQNGISHEKLMADISGPCVFMHAKDAFIKDSILMAASSDVQARRAVSLISDCTLKELVSGHNIHAEKPDLFIEAINSLEEK
jgi:pimeloyl-ACP methyl ester carboxylesterase